MNPVNLKPSTQVVFNPTGRFDISASSLMFEVQPDGGMTRCRLVVRSWAGILNRLNGNELLNLDFQVDNGPKRRASIGRAADIMRRGGIITLSENFGTLEDVNSLSVTLLITDPSDNHRIVAKGYKSKPDAVVEDIKEKTGADRAVAKFHDVRGDALSIVDMRVSANAKGKYSLLLEDVDVPTLLISPSLGKKALLSDERLLCLTLEGVVREVITVMAFHCDEYDGQPWFDVWRKFAANLCETGDWEHLADEDLSVRERRERVNEAVAAFSDRHFSSVSFETTTDDFSEE